MNTKRDSDYLIRDLILKLLLVIGFVAILVWLFPTKSSLGPLYQEIFRNNLNSMRIAADSYYTNERLPEKVNDSIRMSLGEMLDKNLLLEFVDKSGNKCDYYKSYVEITRTETEYELKVNLSCDGQEAFIIEHIGCYDKCGDGKTTAPAKCPTCPDCKECPPCDDTKIEKVTEYQFKKVTSEKKTYYTCPTGYTLKDKVCYKTTSKTESKPAKPIYTGGDVSYKDKVCTGGGTSYITANSWQETEWYEDGYENTRDTTSVFSHYSGWSTWVDKPYSSAMPTGNVSNTLQREFVKMSSTCSGCNGKNMYIYRERTRTAVYTTVTGNWKACVKNGEAYEGSGTSWCHKTKSRPKTVYGCPAGYTQVSGDQTKCYKKTDQVCTCPSGYTENSKGQCEKRNGSTIVGYQCDSGWNLDSKNKTCTKKVETTDKKNATKQTKTVTGVKYTWSTSKTLNGWTATGKTRSVTKK